MASSSLDTESLKRKVLDILKENPTIPGLESFTSKPDEITVEQDPLLEIGQVNFLVRVRAGDGSTVIAKYAPPYAKRCGKKAQLSQARVETEWIALRLFEQHSPGSTPKPYIYSSKHSTILMEELVGFSVLAVELRAGNINKKAIEAISVHLATIHKATHRDNVTAEKWEKLHEINKNLFMIKAVIPTFTSFLYIREPQDDAARQLKQIADTEVFCDSKLTALIGQVPEDACHKKECLIHSDAHINDLLVKGDDGKLIDLEFAHLGPISRDLGCFLAHLVIAYNYHLLSPEDNDKHRQIAYKIQDCCSHMMNAYLGHMSWSTGERSDHVDALLKDTAVQIGFELFRTVCSGDQRDQGAAEVEMLEAGIRLLKQHHLVDSVDKMMYIALALG